LEVLLNRQRVALVGALLAVPLVIFTPQVAASRDAIVAVNGQNFHIETLGSSGPTVVFEAGQGNDFTTWRLVAGPVAKFAHVVLYNRAGLGKSLPLMRKSTAVTADAVATDLRALLTAADIPPPYILVGHSLGGLYVQMFARKYPGDVSGVVLLDSSSTDAPTELTTRATLEPGTAAYLEEEGVAESNRQVANAGPFPNVPLTVIAATDQWSVFQGMGGDPDAASTATRHALPPGQFDCCAG
jgi:pimeloyl-ACP methyl ester carboxylesterase